MRRGPSGAWGLLGLLALAPACTAEEDLPTNRCLDDRECGASTCDPELSMCVGTPPRPLRIGLEVRPVSEPFGGSVQPVAFEPFELEGATERDLVLPIGIPTTGAVRDTMTGQLVSADIELTLLSPIPGGPAGTVTAQATEEARTADDGYVYNFATQLLPGREYAVTVNPTGDWRARRPPMRFATRYGSPEYGPARLDFLRYPGICADPAAADAPCLAEIQGSVRNADGVPQDGMVVKIIDRASGATLSSRYVTGSDPAAPEGFFRVVFPVERWRDASEWFLEISPSSERVARLGPAPTFTVPPSALLEVEGRVTVVAPDPAPLAITYSGLVETEDARPLADAAIRFSAHDIVDPRTGVVGSWTTTVFTDADGTFTDVPLLGTAEGVEAPPTYEIVITPSQTDESLGVLREERQLGASAAGQLFTVPNRARFGGTVQTAEGMRLAGARVTSEPRGGDRDGALSPVALFARSSGTVTDADGLFVLPLDVGLYDLVIEPPMETGFPWRVVPDLAIGGAEAPLTSVYELEHPVPVRGVARWGIEDASGRAVPVSGGEVRAYAVLGDEEEPRAVLIGRATTGPDGAYTLLLPPSI